MRREAVRRSRDRLATLLVVALRVLSTSAAQGLEPTPRPLGSGLSVASGFSFERWKEDRTGLLGQSLSQASTWVLTTIPLRSTVSLDVLSAWASTDWKDNGSRSGFRDTKLTLSAWPREPWVLRVGVNLPTGVTALDAAELRLAQGVANRLEGYQANKLGEGFDVDLGGAFATELRGLALGVGASYLRKGAYTLFAGQDDYDPGDELSVVLGVDGGTPAYFWRADAIFNTHGKDHVGGQSVFQFGDRLRLESGFRQRNAGPFAWQLTARAILQADSKTWEQTGELPTETRESRGREYYVDGQIESQVLPRLRLLALVGTRFFSGSPTGQGDGHRVDVGPGARFAVSPNLSLTGRFRYGWGRIDVPGASPGEADTVDLGGDALDIGLQYSVPR
jgi:hypothetical protein